MDWSASSRVIGKRTVYLLVLCLLGWIPAAAFDPPAIFLTWKDDPSRSIVIDWHTHDTAETPGLQYRHRDAGESWRSAVHDSRSFPFGPHFIHRAALSGLNPGSRVEFRWTPGGPVYYFRTMPAELDRPLRIVFGGDTMVRREWMDRVNELAMAEDPDFVVWGGDLAYADGRESNLRRWLQWFQSVKQTLIAQDGRVVPVVVAIGNHEVREGYVSARRDYEQSDAVRAAMAPYFYTFFAFPGQPGYRVLDFGEYLSLVILDSGHTNPIPGPQTEWLRAVLAERREVAHVIPVYHVPAYPSHRSYEESLSRDVREHWVPLFEDTDVALAIEHHDHTYKRTFPLLRGRVDFGGVLYVGDGAWGVETRRPAEPMERWYISASAARRHYILGVFARELLSFRVVDETGEEIDRFSIPPDEPQLSTAVSQIFPRSRSVGGGFWENDWLGLFYALRFPWIYHEQHHWLFVAGREGHGIWFYDPAPEIEWFWTNDRIFPYLYHGRDQYWMYFDRRTGFYGAVRWFLDVGPGGGWRLIPR